MDLLKHILDAVLKVSTRIVGLELAHVADPPDVIPTAVRLRVGPVQLLTGNFFAELHGFEH
jgi:hypothetical protein